LRILALDRKQRDKEITLETRKFVIQETPYSVALRGRTFAFADGRGLGRVPLCGWDIG
jgi:hypothetical protein